MFGSLIVGYLFLGGAGAGVCFVTALLGLFVPKRFLVKRVATRKGVMNEIVEAQPVYQQLVSPCLIVGLVSLGVGVVCLLADLGRLDRIELLFTRSTFSYISIGTWTLTASFILAVLYGAIWMGFVKARFIVLRVVLVFLAVVALVVMVYTGLLLQDMSARPLWATPWILVLFGLSSLSCGVALVLLVGQISGSALLFKKTFQRLSASDAVLIVCEIVALVFYILAIGGFTSLGAPAFPQESASGQALVESMQLLLLGAYSWVFWGVFVLLGLVLPLLLEVVCVFRRNYAIPLTVMGACAGVLLGGFAMRLCIVEAGLKPALGLV